MNQDIVLNRPRKLLSLAHSYVVGNNRRLAHEMTRAGRGRWEVTAAAPTYFHGGTDLRPVELETLPTEPCELVRLPAYLTRFLHLFVYGPELRALLTRPWDLVHCWEEPYIAVGAQVAGWTPRRVPLIYRTAQSLSKQYPPPFNWIESYAMARSAGWICSGRLVAETLQRRRQYAERPMRLIPLGVDLDDFRPDRGAGRHVRRSLGWEADGPPVVGYLGRFSAEKGLDMLMRVLDEVRTPWRALFVGAGSREAALQKWAQGHGDRVRICTDVRHAAVPRYLNAMDVMCAPSQTTPNWREQFGRMLTEAFACAVPVIGSDSGEIPHVLNGAGAVVGEKDELGWRRALEDLLESPGRRQELAERGSARVQSHFSWPIVARQYLDFFDQILEGRRS
jgi:glycosyltransferase involved in cell wall biosynthesis